jgi:hypothetical protein
MDFDTPTPFQQLKNFLRNILIWLYTYLFLAFFYINKLALTIWKQKPVFLKINPENNSTHGQKLTFELVFNHFHHIYLVLLL